MRDPAQDAIEITERRKKLLKTGFQLFTEHTIEAVKLQDVAAASGIGVATLYQ